jgi:5-methylcytosine-specific restriction endonuclease McrA
MTKRDGVRAKRFRSAIARSKPACHICGLPIIYGLPHTDPKSFVIDHVIPLHKGGEDALSNIRAAHRRQTVTATRRSEHASSHQSSDAAGHSTNKRMFVATHAVCSMSCSNTYQGGYTPKPGLKTLRE